MATEYKLSYTASEIDRKLGLIDTLNNQVGNIRESIPTKTSELDNDSGYITLNDVPEANVPTKVSELENDAGYLTDADLPDIPNVPTKTSQLENDSGFITTDDLPEGGSSNYYVTPEQYGAKGDGVTDDTVAIQQAMDTGYPVEFDKNKQYLVSGFTIESNIDLRGNGATLLCTGKTPVDSGSKYCFFVPKTEDASELYDIKISNLNIVVLNHIVGVFHGNQGKNLMIDGCHVEGNADNNPSVESLDSPGANQGFVLYNFSKFAITNNIINDIRSYAISAEEHNSNGIISGNKINNTGRGSIYVRAYNKNIEVTKNEIKNAVRCFTVSDGAIDLYGAGNENIYVNKNFITGYGRQEVSAIGIRIKGSKNVVCSENTVIVDESTHSFSLIFTQDRNDVGCENITIQNNHLSALEGTSYYVIRDDHDPSSTSTATKDLLIQNNHLISNPDVCPTGISVRRNINGLSIIGNYINGNDVAIEFFPSDDCMRTNVICNRNEINDSRIVFHKIDDLKFVNNYIKNNKVDEMLIRLSKCSNVLIDLNSLINTQETQVVSYSECSNFNITETNMFETSEGVVDLHPYTFVKNTSGSEELSFDSLIGSVVGIQMFGYTHQIIDENTEMSPDNLIEYSSANNEGDLTITINGLVCSDSCVKRGLPANKDLANYVDSNGQGWIADYRDWANGVDWHCVEEYIFTGNETVTDYDDHTIVVSWDSLRKDKKTLSSIHRYSYQMFSNAFQSFIDGQQVKCFNVANTLGNAFAISNYNSFFTNAEGFKNMCKTLFDKGTPVKILYALKVPYSTSINSDELNTYKQVSLSIGNNTVSNNKSLFAKVVYLLNDDYSTGVKNTITNEINNFVEGTAVEITTEIEPVEVQNGKRMRTNKTLVDMENYSVCIYNVSDFVTNKIRVTYSVSSDTTLTPAFLVTNSDGNIIDTVMCATTTVGVFTDVYNVPEDAYEIYVNTRMTQTEDVSLRKDILQCLQYETQGRFKDGICKYTYSKEQIDQALERYIVDVARIIGGDA